jgi:hypothetical protein
MKIQFTKYMIKSEQEKYGIFNIFNQPTPFY